MLALTAIACGRPEPPSVVQREPSLDADDRRVLQGVLDDLRSGRFGRSFLVVQSTLAICPARIDLPDPPPGGCLGPAVIDLVSKMLPSSSRVTATLDFQARNASRLPIVGTLGDDVTYISATLTDFISVSDLIRQDPGREVVTFSAPSYPSPRVAVIVYYVKSTEYAVVRLEQQRDGRWAVVDRQEGVVE